MVHPHRPTEPDGCCTWGHTPSQPLVNETHPAFPLRGETLPGPATAFIVSLHGVDLARQIIDTIPKMRAAGSVIKSDMDYILGND